MTTSALWETTPEEDDETPNDRIWVLADLCNPPGNYASPEGDEARHWATKLVSVFQK